MVMDFNLYDINLHMYNHYRRVNSAKSVLNSCHTQYHSKTSHISHRNISWSSRNSSRYSTPVLFWNSSRTPSRTNSQCKIRPKKHDCLTPEEKLPPTRIPPRPQTRRNPKVLPQNQSKVERLKETSQENTSKQSRSTSPIPDYTHFEDTTVLQTSPDGKSKSHCKKKPIPTPRSGERKKKLIPEYEYLQFSLRITEDIIRNDLYTDTEMRRVFNSHIEANRGRLDTKKMLEHIDMLCQELNINKPKSCSCSECPDSEHTEHFESEGKSTDSPGPSVVENENDILIQKIVTGQEIISTEEIKNLSDQDIQEVIVGLLTTTEDNQVPSQTSLTTYTTSKSRPNSVTSARSMVPNNSLHNIENSSQTEGSYVGNCGVEISTQTSLSLLQQKESQIRFVQEPEEYSNSDPNSSSNTGVPVLEPTEETQPENVVAEIGDSSMQEEETQQPNVAILMSDTDHQVDQSSDAIDAPTRDGVEMSTQTSPSLHQESQVRFTEEPVQYSSSGPSSSSVNEVPSKGESLYENVIETENDPSKNEKNSSTEVPKIDAEDDQFSGIIELPTRDGDSQISDASCRTENEIKSQNKESTDFRSCNCQEQTWKPTPASLDNYVTTYTAYNNDMLNRLKKYEQQVLVSPIQSCTCKVDRQAFHYPSASTQVASSDLLAYEEELSEGEIKSIGMLSESETNSNQNL